MKKKNLFVGLLLASAVFSLAACTDKKPAQTGEKTTDVTTPSTQTTPVTPTSTKPVTPTSTQPVTPSSTTPEETTTEEATLISLSITTDDVKKEYSVGEKLDLTGLVVKGTYDDGETVTLDSTKYEVKLLKGDTEVDADSELEAATYTVKIIVANKNKTFDIVCKVEQYKFNFNLSAHDYNQSLETPHTEDYLFPDGTYTLFDNPSLKIELTAQSSNSQVKLQPGNPRELDGITFNDRFSIHSKYGFVSVTTKATGKVTVYATVNGADRQVIIKEGSTQVAAGATDWSADNLYKITFDAEADKTYTINSSNNGSVVYAVYFEGSVDASTRIATSEFKVNAAKEYDIADNKFDPSNFEATIYATDNYGVIRTVALADCTVTVTNSTQEVVTGAITVAGAYTVTVAYDGKEETFEITVSDPNASISAVQVDSTAAQKKFYEGETAFNADNIVVTATKGVTISLTDKDYTVKLYKGDDEVTSFTTAGEYTVRVYSNEEPTIYGSYTINYYVIEETVITAVTTAKVDLGTNAFTSGATAKVIYTDDTEKDVTSSITAKYYAEETCETEIADAATAFATEGTVYLKVSVNDAAKVIELTVIELTATDYSYSYTTATEEIKVGLDGTIWTTNYDISTKNPDTFNGTDTSIKLVKLLPDKYIQVNFEEAVNKITLSATGLTSGSSSASDYLKIEFLDADGNVIESIIGTTPAGKNLGDFTFKTLDGATTVTFANAIACKAIKFSGTTAGKSVGIATATIKAFN